MRFSQLPPRLAPMVGVLLIANQGWALPRDPFVAMPKPMSIADAEGRMYPLALGAAEVDVPTSDGAILVQHALELNGLPVVNAGLRVKYYPGGDAAVLDAFEIDNPPGRIDARVDMFDAERIARKVEPGYFVRNRGSAYFVERDPKSSDPSLQRLSRVRLVWLLDLYLGSDRSSTEPTARRMVIDAESGEIVGDGETTSEATGASPVFVTGRGYHVKEALLAGSKANTPPGTFCLESPYRSTAPYPPCDANNGGQQGIGAYLFDSDGEDRELIPLMEIASAGTIGNGRAPYGWDDTAAIATVGVDLYVNSQQTIDFYARFFGRSAVGSTSRNNLGLVPYDDRITNNALASYLDSRISTGKRYPEGEPPLSTLQMMGHEYTHLIVERHYQIAETGLLGFSRDYKALQEGLADVFGLLVEPSLAQPGDALSAPASTWALPTGIFLSFGWLDIVRYYANPRDDGSSVNGYGETSPRGFPFDGLAPHFQAGVIRRWFHFLANGFPPLVAGNEAESSTYYPRGMTGVGVDAAARLLYRTVTETSELGVPPTFASFRESMMGMLAAETGCNTLYQQAESAWAAVNIGPGPDTSAPYLSGSMAQVGQLVSVNADVVDRGLGLGGAGQRFVKVLVDGTVKSIMPVTFVASDDSFVRYTGSVQLPLSDFPGTTPHLVALSATDWCNNAITTPLGTMRVDNVAPAFVIDDVTSKRWVGRPEPLANPMVLSTPVRSIYSKTYDASGLSSMVVSVGTMNTYQSLSGVSAERTTSVDFTAHDAPADGTYTLQAKAYDSLGNMATRYLSPYTVDRTPPARCSLSDCEQLYNKQHLWCRVDASDTQSGLFAVEVKTIAPSPALLSMPVQQTSIMHQGWAWGFQDDRPAGATWWARHGTNFLSTPGGPTPPPLTPGLYTVALRCRDFWGNVTPTTTRVVRVSSLPTIQVVNVVTRTDGTYTATIDVADADGVVSVRMRTDNLGDQEDVSCNSQPSCRLVHQAAPGANRTVVLSVTARDAHGALANVQRSITLPPSPSPPSFVDYTEREPYNDCWLAGSVLSAIDESANVLPSSPAVRIHGRTTSGSADFGDCFDPDFSSGELHIKGSASGARISVSLQVKLRTGLWVAYNGVNNDYRSSVDYTARWSDITSLWSSYLPISKALIEVAVESSNDVPYTVEVTHP